MPLSNQNWNFKLSMVYAVDVAPFKVLPLSIKELTRCVTCLVMQGHT